jgi:hypothetical protein
MRINIRADGTIDAIGYMPYQYLCPSFINTMNFSKYRCLDIERIMYEEAWEFIELDTGDQITALT